MVSEKKVSIIVPNFRTLLMTELCLNNLRHYTDLNRAEVIVVDNDSQDESVEYLRHLDWITLLERKTEGESGPLMHSRALDLALSEVDSEYVLVMHTDTIVKRPDWLDFLLGKIEAEEGIAAVGSWKSVCDTTSPSFLSNRQYSPLRGVIVIASELTILWMRSA